MLAECFFSALRCVGPAVNGHITTCKLQQFLLNQEIDVNATKIMAFKAHKQNL